MKREPQSGRHWKSAFEKYKREFKFKLSEETREASKSWEGRKREATEKNRKFTGKEATGEE